VRALPVFASKSMDRQVRLSIDFDAKTGEGMKMEKL